MSRVNSWISRSPYEKLVQMIESEMDSVTRPSAILVPNHEPSNCTLSMWTGFQFGRCYDPMTFIAERINVFHIFQNE